MKQFILFILCFSLLIFGMQTEESRAGSISLQVKSIVQIKPELLSIRVSIKNKGNESATEIQPAVRFLNKPRQLQGIDQISPGQTKSFQILKKNHPFQKKGIYYLPLHIAYRDSNGFLFTLPYMIQIVNRAKTNAGLKWSISQVVLPTDDSVEVTLTNQDPWSKTIQLSSATAMKIELDLPKDPFVLKGNKDKTWNVKIKHDSIWPNNYVSYLIAEFSYQGYHHSTYTPLTMKILSESSINPIIFSRPVMTAALISLTTFAVIGGYGPSLYSLYRKIWQKPF